MAGRRPLNGTKMKPNGLPKELDDWFLAEGTKLYGKGGGARLKREVLENYRKQQEQPASYEIVVPIEIPQTLVSGE